VSRSTRKSSPIPPEMLRVRRAALAEIIRAGGCPEPWQFERAGLPVLVRASDLLAVEAVTDAMNEARAQRPRPRRPGPAF